jgi:hypothetical protein
MQRPLAILVLCIPLHREPDSIVDGESAALQHGGNLCTTSETLHCSVRGCITHGTDIPRTTVPTMVLRLLPLRYREWNE